MKTYLKSHLAKGCLLALATLCPAQRTVSEPFDFEAELGRLERQLEFERIVMDAMPKGVRPVDLGITVYADAKAFHDYAQLSISGRRAVPLLDANAIDLIVRKIESAQPASWRLSRIHFDCEQAFGTRASCQGVNLGFMRSANDSAARPERKLANPFDGWRLLAGVATEASGEDMEVSWRVKLAWWATREHRRDEPGGELTCTVQIFGERFRGDYVQLLKKIHQACEQTAGSFRLSQFSRSAEVLNNVAPGVNGGEYQITIKLGERDSPDLAEPAVRKKKKSRGADR